MVHPLLFTLMSAMDVWKMGRCMERDRRKTVAIRRTGKPKQTNYDAVAFRQLFIIKIFRSHQLRRIQANENTTQQMKERKKHTNKNPQKVDVFLIKFRFLCFRVSGADQFHSLFNTYLYPSHMDGFSLSCP